MRFLLEEILMSNLPLNVLVSAFLCIEIFEA